MGKQEVAGLVKLCVDTIIKTQKLPHIEDIMTAKFSVAGMQDVKIEDLLGSEEVQLDM